MPRIDHVAVESPDPAGTAFFYERILGAKVAAAEGHPVMVYLGATGFAFHEPGGPGPHTGIRVSEEERAAIAERLKAAGIEHWEHDHGIAAGLFFRDPDGRLLEAITYTGGEDYRRAGETNTGDPVTRSRPARSGSPRPAR